MKTLILLFIFVIASLDAKEYFYEYNKKISLKKDYSISSTAKVKYFINQKGQSIVIKDQFVIKLKQVAAVTALILEFDLEIIKKFNNNKYIMGVKNIDKIFLITNEINSRTAVLYAYPVYVNKSMGTKYNPKKTIKE